MSRERARGGAGAVGETEEASMSPFVRIGELVRRHPGRIVLVLLGLGFAWFIWPTPYQTVGPRGVEQVNRFTGVRCDVGESCWREPPESSKPTLTGECPPAVSGGVVFTNCPPKVQKQGDETKRLK
jgi:hypothetical protein